jgi:hypothetical protein
MIVLKDVLALLNGELLTPGIPLEVECPRVFASDLMSDVLSSAEPGSLLLTGLANSHVVSTCAVADLAAVVFVQGKRPGLAVVEEARTKSLPLIATGLSMFDTCLTLAALFKDPAHGR